MTGHMLGAAGGAEAVASVLALRDGIAPPTIDLKQPDPDCDLDYTPLTAKHADFDVALSSSLGFGGHNACLAFRKWEGCDAGRNCNHWHGRGNAGGHRRGRPTGRT